MSRVGKTNEKRAEQRLRYRWPVRFAVKAGQKPLSGQAVDITSRGMAFLYHPGENCPRPDQLITANFGTPHFNAHGSFDTVFFNRVGRVCRVDSLSGKISRVAIQFAEPLFFKPGEQNISDSDAQQRLEAKARSVIKARQKTGTRDEALVEAENRARAETQRWVKTEKEAQKKVRACAKQIAKVRAEAAGEIARVSAEAANAIAGIEAEFTAKAATGDRAKDPGVEKKNGKQDAGQARDQRLLKKVDSFITDKSKVF
ncbi:MAG: hypothetical protein JSW66_09700 [Phycisphaerales bacterium]|nr:MAG: hypothetical protein JSW66_09700 [Phycisphaerales bacterium]